MAHVNRRNKKAIAQHGFTAIELLVTMSIVSILAATSMLTYYEDRNKSYIARGLSAMSDLRTAMASAHIDRDLSNMVLLTTTDQPGPVTTGDGQTLLPGFVNSKDVQLTASYSGPCESGISGASCVLELASVNVCKVGYQHIFMRFKDGVVIDSESLNSPWC